MEILRGMPEAEGRAIGERARERVLAAHTAAHSASELEGFTEVCRYQGAEKRNEFCDQGVIK